MEGDQSYPYLSPPCEDDRVFVLVLAPWGGGDCWSLPYIFLVGGVKARAGCVGSHPPTLSCHTGGATYLVDSRAVGPGASVARGQGGGHHSPPDPFLTILGELVPTTYVVDSRLTNELVKRRTLDPIFRFQGSIATLVGVGCSIATGKGGVSPRC